MVMVPVKKETERGSVKTKKRKRKNLKVAGMSERFTFINPQAVHHSGANNFIGVPVAENPLDLVTQSAEGKTKKSGGYES